MPKKKHRILNAIITIEKLILFLFTFALVIFLTLTLYNWGNEFKNYFLYLGNIESYVMLFLLVWIIAYVLRKLLIWQWRLEFGGRR